MDDKKACIGACEPRAAIEAVARSITAAPASTAASKVAIYPPDTSCVWTPIGISLLVTSFMASTSYLAAIGVSKPDISFTTIICVFGHC